jgi:acetyl esterase/lipase
MPMAGAFFSPWADMLCEGESYKFNYEKDAMFGNKAVGSHEERRKRLIQSEIFSYANHLSEDERKHPYVSPVYGSYKGFPPVFISAGENEMLLSDSETIGKKLTEAGSKVTMVKGEGMFHIYALFTLLPQARVAMKELENFSGSI